MFEYTIKNLDHAMLSERGKIEYDQTMITLRNGYIEELSKHNLSVDLLFDNPIAFYDLLVYQNDFIIDDSIIDTLVFVRHSRSETVKTEYDKVLSMISDNKDLEPPKETKQSETFMFQGGDST